MRRIALNLLPALALFAALGAPAGLSAQFTDFEQALADFDAEVAAAVAEDAGGAVSVAVFHGDEVIWSKGWGWADIEGRVPADAHTIGRTGSISKTFTAVLMMQLVERGIIGLDDPVLPYLPEMAELRDPPVDPGSLTFRQLASHTAGLEREPGLPGAARGPIQQWEEQIIASVPTTGFLTPPGTGYAYSNIGYGMLGLALSRAAGVDFMELMQTLVFGPLGMEDSFFILQTPEHIRRMSKGYARDRETGRVSAAQATAEHMGRGYKVPNGGVYSTVHDLAAFAAALMGAGPVQILSPESREAMRTPQAPAERYGLGLQLREVEGQLLAGHGGSVAGYNANLRFHAESGLGVAMLRTTSYNPELDALLLELVAAEQR
jgi:CubicO group peptidase (beta-lactamase class C family)